MADVTRRVPHVLRRLRSAGDTSALARLRAVVLGFALATYAVGSAAAVIVGPGGAAMAGGIVAYGALGLWAVALGRWPTPIVAEAIVPLAAIAIGAATGEALFPVIALFASALLRAVHGRGADVAVATGAYVIAAEAVLLVTGALTPTSPTTLLHRIGLPLFAWVLYGLADALRDHERAIGAGQLLADAGERLVAAKDREEIQAVAVDTLGHLTESHPGIEAGLWLRTGERLHLKAGHGERHEGGLDTFSVSAVPKQVFAALERGESVVTHGREAAVLQGILRAPVRYRAIIASPLRERGRLSGALIVGGTVSLPTDLAEAVKRLSYTVGLALERRAMDERFRTVVDHLWDTIAILDANQRLEFVSPSVERLLGYQPGDLEGVHVGTLMHPEDAERLQTDAETQSWLDRPVEIRLRTASGSYREVEIATNGITTPAGDYELVVAVRDITDRRALESEVTFRAFHDPITDLPNRSLFIDRAAQALGRARRTGRAVGIAFVDLDDFKTVNDSLGHSAGDVLLATIGRRLVAAVRETDTVARLGGDEFALLLEDLRGQEEAAALCRRALAALDHPCRLEGRDVTVRASLGVVISDGSESDPGRLLRDADLAMYAAKDAGKARLAVFDPSMHTAAVRKLELRSELRRAFERREFFLAYQPIVRIGNGRVTAVEALLRWQHPARGVVSPGEFIPLAEEDGLIVPLGRWVIEEACHQLRTWLDAYRGPEDLVVTVNLSGEQYTDPELVPTVRRAIEQAGIPPHTLILEITEGSMMRDVMQTRRTLDALRDVGARIAVDDFGNGYSSLSYLRDFPLDFLKIDKSFVDGIDVGPEEGALAHAVVKLAQNLGLDPTAEGIERSPQAAALKQWGCTYGQGYLFSRPTTGAAITSLLDRDFTAEIAGEPATPVPAEKVS